MGKTLLSSKPFHMWEKVQLVAAVSNTLRRRNIPFYVEVWGPSGPQLLVGVSNLHTSDGHMCAWVINGQGDSGSMIFLSLINLVLFPVINVEQGGCLETGVVSTAS